VVEFGTKAAFFLSSVNQFSRQATSEDISKKISEKGFIQKILD
jgi:hypothetical protein